MAPAKGDRNSRVRRLIYQASYTGMKETDLILGHFAMHHLSSLTDEELGDFEALLAAGDDRIYAWIIGDVPVPDHHNNRVFNLIKKFNN